jgi:hypothetical protein
MGRGTRAIGCVYRSHDVSAENDLTEQRSRDPLPFAARPLHTEELVPARIPRAQHVQALSRRLERDAADVEDAPARACRRVTSFVAEELDAVRARAVGDE